MENRTEYIKQLILNILEREKACYGRELEVRLEGKDNIEHWDVWRVRKEMKNKREVRTFHQRTIGATFYYPKNLKLNDIKNIIGKKTKLIQYLRKISEAEDKSLGRHAENIILEALRKCNFNVLNRDFKWFQGREYDGEEDLDFLAEKDDIYYGVEVKNKLDNIKWKDSRKKDIETILEICKTLGLVPMIITRYLPGMYKRRLIGSKALIIDYKDLIVHPDFKEYALKWKSILGFPVYICDRPPQNLLQKITGAHNYSKKQNFWDKWKKD